LDSYWPLITEIPESKTWIRGDLCIL
jgi:hypothetical protein